MAVRRRSNEEAFVAGFLWAIRATLKATTVFTTAQQKKIVQSANVTAQMAYEEWKREDRSVESVESGARVNTATSENNRPRKKSEPKAGNPSKSRTQRR